LDPANGAIVWAFEGQPDRDVDSSPAIALDGSIVFGGDNNKVFALFPDMTVKWTTTLGGDVNSSPAVSADGTVYVGSDDRKLYALREADGSVLWSLQSSNLFGQMRSSPSIGKSGAIYMGSSDNKLYSVGSFACSPAHPSSTSPRSRCSLSAATAWACRTTGSRICRST
ncbi:MAG: PQQ-binding-like beta-propeller repeat protein, partial [Steroidobacteraceae bacterium]